MISLHILEEYERQVLLTRQTSIAHACAIIQRKQHIRMRGFLLHWYRLTLGIRAAEQNHCANVIQRYWRKFRLLMNFRWLTQEYRAFVRRVSATKVQAAARRFLAIRAFQRLLFEHRRFVAAIRIQKCYGNYQICKIAQRQRQQDAVLSIQRVWRGHRGRNRAKYRQQLLRRVAEKMVLGIWRETALKRVRVKRVLVTRIQHCVRVFTFRCRVARAFVQNRRRCLFLPALRIQNAWHTYRQSEIFRSVYAMVAIIVEQRESAASLIQMKFKRYYHWKQERSAGIITKLLRAFKSRKIVMARQLEWLHGWSTLNFLRWEGHCPLAMQRWSALTARVERGLHDIEYDQHHALKRLNVFEGVRFVLLIKCFHKDFLADNAVKIQVNWRWHHFRSVMRKRMQAALLIQRSIPLLHKAYKKRQQRKRVLGRWKRQRYCSMKASFQQWRVFQKLIQEARSLKVTNESLRRMKWFRHQKLRKGMMTRWKIFIECRHERARRLEQAIELNALHTKRRFWRTDSQI
uniref:Uncharacterized protein n=1 Tax=Globisporangium ultimum (strain ATCC 200006 / CBS 805.95 / DAOM BR144) TaxID=431595 RepID=K3X9Q3_GLOUD